MKVLSLEGEDEEEDMDGGRSDRVLSQQLETQTWDLSVPWALHQKPHRPG